MMPTGPVPGKDHAAVAAQIERRIADGTYRVGWRLPNEQALAQEYGTTRARVRTALARRRCPGEPGPRRPERSLAGDPPDGGRNRGLDPEHDRQRRGRGHLPGRHVPGPVVHPQSEPDHRERTLETDKVALFSGCADENTFAAAGQRVKAIAVPLAKGVTMGKIFGREPVLWLSLVAIVVKVVSAFLVHVSTDQQAVINAAAAAVAGLLVALTTHDGVSGAILGVVQAMLALGVGFGLKWTPDQQAMVMSLAATIVAMFVRTQVTAPVPASAVTARVAPARTTAA